ncbi:MAG: S1 family peptidase [Oligoflexia bacterium]|nr:S1 family peptidase [Oligoflexia bacterium]
MKRFFPILVLLSLTVILVSCAKEKSSSKTVESPIYKIPTTSLEAAVRIASNASPKCAKGSDDCSLSVGLLTYATSDGAAQCTASLVAPNIILTNTHCVPDDLKKANSSCSGRMWMNFIQASGYDSKLECDRVLFASDKRDGKIEADYAYIKLAKSSNRPYFEMSREGFSDNELVHLYKMNPISAANGFSGELKKVVCRTVMDSLLPKKFDVQSNTSSVVTFADCQVIPGNSGGPIVGASGKVKGVIFALLRVQANIENLARYGINSTSTTHRYMSLGTNLRCLKDKSLYDSATSDCSNEAIEQSLESARSIYNQKQLEANTEIQKVVSEKPELAAFKWTFKPKTFTKNANADGKEYVHLSFLQPYCYVRELKDSIMSVSSISRPILESEISFNERFLPKYLLKKTETYRLDENLQAVDEGANLRVRFQPNGSLGANLSSGYESVIPACL